MANTLPSTPPVNGGGRSRADTASVIRFHTDEQESERLHADSPLSDRIGGNTPAASSSQVELQQPKPLRRQDSLSTKGEHPSHTWHHGQPAPAREQTLSPPHPIVDAHKLAHHVSMSQLKTKEAAEAEPAAAAAQQGAPGAEKAPDVKEYAEILSLVDVENGLTEEVVLRQREKHGFNESIEKEVPLWLLFLQKFRGAVPFMIIVAMAVSFGLEEWVNGTVIAILLLANGLLSFNEDLRARKAMRELVKSLQIMVRVKRKGEWKELPARELVPGDLLRLRTGDLAGADVCLLNGHLSVDQSALTGESVLKNMARESLVFAGSIIKRGEANAAVVAVGGHTYFGKTAQLVQAAAPNPHIQRILTRIVGLLMAIIILLIVVTLIVMGVRDDDMVQAIPLLLMVVITALPVALPAMFTVSMALGSKELSRRGVLVTRLNVLEDCALMSILFSDKTGTLSQNMMTVQSVVPLLKGASEHDVLLAASLCSRAENADPIDRAMLEGLVNFVAPAPEASQAVILDEGQTPADIKGMLPAPASDAYDVLKFVPFDAATRRTEALVRVRGSSDVVSRVTKGAVATLAQLAGITLDSPEYARIDSIVDANAAKGFKTVAVGVGFVDAEEGKRDHDADERQALLAEGDPHAVPHGQSAVLPPGAAPKFRLLGLVSIHDPPRADSEQVIARLSALGIRTKMLTGDSMGVAVEMGRNLKLGHNFVNLEHEKQLVRKQWSKETEARKQLGTAISNAGAAGDAASKEQHAVVPSAGAEEVRLTIPGDAPPENETPEEFEKRLMNHLLARFDPMSLTGFAQIFPADKHAIVLNAQSKGFVCGMTGDGVNDAPSLKQAEVGCAVSNATDVAKGSASALLLHEGISGVVDMVTVGRQVHARVQVWVVNKVAKAAQHSVFILLLFLILGRFPISALQVVLLLLLMDFVLISIATDVQPAGSAPSKWKLGQLTRVGLAIGIPGAGEMIALVLVSEDLYDMSTGESETLAWLLMFVFGMLSVFAAREKSFFWHSRPSFIMGGLVFVEMIGVWLVCSLGVPGLPKIGFAMSTAMLAIACGFFVINDALKVLWIKFHEHDYHD